MSRHVEWAVKLKSGQIEKVHPAWSSSAGMSDEEYAYEMAKTTGGAVQWRVVSTTVEYGPWSEKR
jgi:hypothetical protein